MHALSCIRERSARGTIEARSDTHYGLLIGLRRAHCLHPVEEEGESEKEGERAREKCCWAFVVSRRDFVADTFVRRLLSIVIN